MTGLCYEVGQRVPSGRRKFWVLGPGDRAMRHLIPLFVTLLFVLSCCGGVNTFTTFAQSESTISFPAGWRQGFTKDNITVTITGSVSTVTIYPPGDPHIRAVTNMHPDPVSSLVIDTRIGDPNNHIHDLC